MMSTSMSQYGFVELDGQLILYACCVLSMSQWSLLNCVYLVYECSKSETLCLDLCCCVCSEKHYSYKINFGVPHGSILGPTSFFNLYMQPLGHVIRRHSIHFHSILKTW